MHDSPNIIAEQARCVIFIMAVDSDLIRLPVQDIEATVERTDPEIPVPVLVDRPDHVVAQAVGKAGSVLIQGKLIRGPVVFA